MLAVRKAYEPAGRRGIYKYHFALAIRFAGRMFAQEILRFLRQAIENRLGRIKKFILCNLLCIHVVVFFAKIIIYLQRKKSQKIELPTTENKKLIKKN